MDFPGLLLVALVMAVGLVGIVIPLLPGSALIAAAALAWAAIVGTGSAWAVWGAVVVVLAAGTVAKYVLPARRLRGSGAPRSTMLAGAVGAIVGFFLVPVVGVVLGGLAGVFTAELRRHGGDAAAAWRSTWATVRAIGFGLLVELGAGVLAVSVWAVAAFLG